MTRLHNVVFYYKLVFHLIVMQKLIKTAQKACMPAVSSLPIMAPGDIVNIHVKIREQKKERIQQFCGSIIQIRGETAHIRTIVVRKLANGIGIERIFPIPSPNIVKVEVKRKAKVRRANLSYLRNTKSSNKTKVKYKI